MDKLVHFLCGLVIALTVGLYTAPCIGLIAAVLAGVAKEIYDIKGTKFNILDFVYTSFGGFLGILILYLFKQWKNF